MSRTYFLSAKHYSNWFTPACQVKYFSLSFGFDWKNILLVIILTEMAVIDVKQSWRLIIPRGQYISHHLLRETFSGVLARFITVDAHSSLTSLKLECRMMAQKHMWSCIGIFLKIKCWKIDKISSKNCQRPNCMKFVDLRKRLTGK